MSEPVTLTFIFQTIGVILAITAVGIILVKIKAKNILFTGQPGIGKTTLIKKIAVALPGKVSGFYTEEIRRAGKRIGFKIISFTGKEGILAHVNIKSDKRVSRYGVNLKDIEQIGVKAISDGLKFADFVIIDEIGKMELHSKKFIKVLQKALESKKILIATILQKSHPVADKIKARKDVKLFKITKENRHKLVQEIVNELIK